MSKIRPIAMGFTFRVPAPKPPPSLLRMLLETIKIANDMDRFEASMQAVSDAGNMKRAELLEMKRQVEAAGRRHLP